MKKVLVLTAVLCFAASMSHAAILDVWLTSDNMNPAANATVNLTIWMQIVPDPSLTAKLGHLEDVTNFGVSDVAVTISHVDTNIKPVVFTPGVAKTAWNFASFDFGTYIKPAISADGYNTIQCGSATSGFDPTIGAASPIWMATETWKEGAVKGMTELQLSTLNVVYQGPNVQPYFAIGQLVTSARHWDYSDPTGAIPVTNKNYCTAFQPGVLVGGTFVAGQNLILNAPEPATLALLGFGAVATLLRRRNKK